MNQLMRWTFLFAALMMVIKTSPAWNISMKNSIAGGPVVHSTYFLTNNNAPFDVRAQAYVGTFVNNICQYNEIYDMGVEKLQTGDIVYIDGFKLKSMIGTAYNCITIYYTSQQIVHETFWLTFDGVNYVNSDPFISEVTIL